jgi:hypothetical protein
MLGSSNLVAMSFLAWLFFFSSRVLTYEKQNRTSSELQQLKIVELNFFVSITSTQSIPSVVLSGKKKSTEGTKIFVKTDYAIEEFILLF